MIRPKAESFTVLLLWLMTIFLSSGAIGAPSDSLILTEKIDIKTSNYNVEYDSTVNGVSIIEFEGNYDKDLDDGAFNVDPRALVAQEFYRHNADNYDFLVVFTKQNFDFGDVAAFHLGISNTVEGIGMPLYSNAESFGSDGELKGYIDMNSLGAFQANPLSVDTTLNSGSFEYGLKTLAHEVLHQWAAYPAIAQMQGRDGGHWSFFLDTDGSLQYGHDWVDNLDGSFTAEAARVGYSSLDLYLMGLISKDKVDPMFVVSPSGNEYGSEDLPAQGVTITGTKQIISIDEIIQQQGERVPGPNESQKEFRFGFIYLNSSDLNFDNGIEDEVFAKISTFREEFSKRFSILTNGRAVANVAPLAVSPVLFGSQDVVQTNGDISVDPRSLELALDWLKGEQSEDGSWADKTATGLRDTTSVINTFKLLGVDRAAVSLGQTWLSAQATNNTDSLARQLALSPSEARLDSLLEIQKTDGGWSLDGDLASSVLDTSLGVCAISSVASKANQAAIQSGVDFILSQQSSGGGWSHSQGGESAVGLTAKVLNSLYCSGVSREQIAQPLDWLSQQINVDNGFGDQSSQPHVTADVLLAFSNYGSTSQLGIGPIIDYLFSQQSSEGDWWGSVFTTARVLSAIKSISLPNLFVDSISTPEVTILDGDLVRLDVRVVNGGTETAAENSLSIYEGDPAQGGVFIAQLDLPEMTQLRQVDASFYWNSFGKSGEATLFAVVDSDNVVDERSEADNGASITVLVASAPNEVELTVDASSIYTDPAEVSFIPSQVMLHSTLRNIGLEPAPQVKVDLLTDGDNGRDILDSKLVDLPARSTSALTFSFEKSDSSDQNLYIEVDLDDQYSEENEENNTAEYLLTTSSTVDLEVLTSDIVIPSANLYLNQLAHIGLSIRNRGTVPANDVALSLTVSSGAGESNLLGLRVNLEPGEQQQFTADWVVDSVGPSTITAIIDKQNEIAEANEGNNTAESLLNAALLDAKNLSVDPREYSAMPSVGLQSMGSTLSATIRNVGAQNVDAVDVRFYDGNPSTGGSLIAETRIVNLLSSSAQIAEVTWNEIATAGRRFIYVLVDPENTIVEADESDNQAFIEYDVISLPDLAISTESLSTDPRFPRIDSNTNFSVSISNRGMQDANDVPIRAYLGSIRPDNIISEATFDVAGGGSAEWTFTYDFASLGDQTIVVAVDPDNAIRELNENNNELAKTFGIQDGNFYLSDLYLSPDNNGEYDTVDYTFLLEESQLVSVVVVDKYGNEIYEFTFESAVVNDQITWDGRNRFNGVVADGVYQISVKDLNGSYIGTRSVTVDTNRSPLSEAIDTKYGLERNLTCRIGEVREEGMEGSDTLVYSPDNQFIYFTTFFEEYDDDEGNLIDRDALHPLPTGLYRAANDGSQPTQLLDNDDINITSIQSISVSSDGGKLVLGLDSYNTVPSIWSLTIEGEELAKIVEFDAVINAGSRLFSQPQFLPSGEILYHDITGSYNSKNKKIWQVADSEGAIPRLVFDVANFGPDAGFIQPKLNKQGTNLLIRVFENTLPQRQSFNSVEEFALSPPDFTLVNVDLRSVSHTALVEKISTYEWSPNGAVFAVGIPSEGKIRVYDRNLIEQKSIDFLSSPLIATSDRLAILESISNDFASIGDLSNVYTGSVVEIVWNPDSSEFAFLLEDYLPLLLEELNDGGGEQSKTNPFIEKDLISTESISFDFVLTDGLYISKLSNTDITKVAVATPSYVDQYQPSAPEKLSAGKTKLDTDLSKSDSSIEIVDSVNTLGFPLSAGGYPIIEDILPAVVRGYYPYYPRINLINRLKWLNGAREVIVNPSLKGVDVADCHCSRPPPVVTSNKVALINLDNIALDSKYIFENRNFIPSNYDDQKLGVYPTNASKFLSYFSSDQLDRCPSFDEIKGYRQFQSLLNLTADLRVRRGAEREGFLMDGSAIDKNFSRYELHYSDVNSADVWTLLAPPSDTPVIDDRFTTWVPPYIGSFYVRLSVYDKAGNARQVVRRVINSESASISGLYVGEVYFSPNGDGVKDETSLNFKVLENVNLELKVFNSEGVQVNSFFESYDLLGSVEKTVWNGRDYSNNVVADGVYRLEIQTYEFFVTVDNTPPVIVDISAPVFTSSGYVVNVNVDNLVEYKRLELERCLLASRPPVPSLCNVRISSGVIGKVFEPLLARLEIQSKLSSGGNWGVANSLDSFPNSEWNTVTADFYILGFRHNDIRIVAEDYAGNKTIIEAHDTKRNRAHLLGQVIHPAGTSLDIPPSFVPKTFGNPGGLDFDQSHLDDIKKPRLSTPNRVEELHFHHTATTEVDFYELNYRRVEEDNLTFNKVVINPRFRQKYWIGGPDSSLSFNFDLNELEEFSGKHFELFIKVHLKNGSSIETDTLRYIVDQDYEIDGGLLDSKLELSTTQPALNIERVLLFIKSVGEREDTRYSDDQITNRIGELVTGGLDGVVNPGGVLTRIIDDRDLTYFRIYPEAHTSDGERIELINECGYAYRYSVVYILADGSSHSIPIEEEASCANLTVDIDPVFTGQCNAEPSNRVIVQFRIGQVANFFAVSTPQATPITLKLGFPLGNIGTGLDPNRILQVENLPDLFTIYNLEVDTSLLPEGSTDLVAELLFDDGKRLAERIAIPVVKSLPEVSVTYPREGEKVCANQYRRSGLINGVEVVGTASSLGRDMEVGFDGVGSRVGILDGSACASCGLGLYDLESSKRRPSPLAGLKKRDKIIDASVEGGIRLSDDQNVVLAPMVFDDLRNRTSTNGVLALAEFDVSGLVTLKAHARNWSGASICSDVTFEVDAEIEDLEFDAGGGVERFVSKPRIFSPNADGHYDEVYITVSVNESVVANVDVYSRSYNERTEKYEFIDIVARPYIDQSIDTNGADLSWDGRDDSGDVLEDGIYAIKVELRDGCGNTESYTEKVEIDATPPTVVISYPEENSALPIVIKPIASVQDVNRSSYVLSIIDGDGLSSVISSGSAPYTGPAGEWDSYGAEGGRIFRLEATDIVNNTSFTERHITLPVRENLISSLDTTNYYVSPNEDGRLDTLTIRVGFLKGVTASVSIKTLSGDLIANLAVDKAFTKGYSSILWDGLNSASQVANDNVYLVEVVASDTVNLQTESIEFELDNTAPAVALQQLTDGTIELKGESNVLGVIRDRNFESYRFVLNPIVELNGPSVSSAQVILIESDQAVESIVASIPEFLYQAEAAYTAKLLAKDRAGNQLLLSPQLYLDKIPPRVNLESLDDDFIYNSQQSVRVQGEVEDRFLKKYTLALYENIQAEPLLVDSTGSESNDNVQGVFNLAGLDEGLYTIVLSAQDRSGLHASKSISITVDNTPPTGQILLPASGGYLVSVEPFIGTADDVNFEQFSLSIAQGHNASNGFELKTVSSSRVLSGQLYSPGELSADGQYTVRLIASDKAENESVANSNYTVDTTPPSAIELLTVDFDKRSQNIDLEWQASSDVDVAGYHLFRNGSRLNAELLTDVNYVDESVPEGEYEYYVQVVDLAGLVSEPSNTLTIVADVTPPTVKISSPTGLSRVNLIHNILGTAHSEGDFKEYRLFVSVDGGASQLLRSSPIPVLGGELSQWDTLNLEDGVPVTLRLEVEDIYENSSSTEVTVTVDNRAPAAPRLNEPVVSDLDDAELSWEHDDVDSDTLGFLLYRGEQLIGVSGTVIGDLRPYAIASLNYLDVDLVDGQHEWLVYAIDQVGNVSEPSNLVSLTLDNRPPSAVIINIEEGLEFDNTLYILAETPDKDIAEVSFQYRLVSGDTWLDIGSDNKEPYEYSWDTQGVDYGVYQLRALATDLGAKSDPSPEVIQIVKKDIEPPLGVNGLDIFVEGSEASLTWDANTETDLLGYNVYEGYCETCTFDLLNSNPIPENEFERTVTYDSVRQYRVTAIDTSDNESVVSETVIGVYADTLLAVDNVVASDYNNQATVRVEDGMGTFEQVDINIIDDQNVLLQTTIDLDTPASTVENTVNYGGLGLNRISTTVSSVERKYIARPSANRTIVVQGVPSPPLGGSAVYDDGAQLVNLSWDENPVAEKVAGYFVYKDGVKLSSVSEIRDSTAFATSGSGASNFLPTSRFSDYWSVNTSNRNVQFGQTWSQPRLVSSIDLHWLRYNRAATLVSVEVLIDGEYVSVAVHVKPIFDAVANIQLPTPVLTSAVRLTTLSWYRSNSTAYLYEMTINAEDIISDEVYADTLVTPENRVVTYQLQAVDQYGGIGELSDEISESVGDVIAPDPIVLSGAEIVDGYRLSWTESSEAGAAYILYEDGIKVVEQFEREYDLPPLKNGTYSFTVTSVDTAGNESEPSNTVIVEIDNPVLSPPINLVAVFDPEEYEIDLDWEPFPGESPEQYIMYVSIGEDDGFDEYEALRRGETNTYFYEIGFETVFRFRVTAVDASGNESAPSEVAMVELPQVVFSGPPIILAPNDPSGVTTSPTNTVDVIGIAQPGSFVNVFNQSLGLSGTANASANAESTYTDQVELYDLVSAPIEIDGLIYVVIENYDEDYILQKIDGEDVSETWLDEFGLGVDVDNISSLSKTTNGRLLIGSGGQLYFYSGRAASTPDVFVYDPALESLERLNLPSLDDASIEKVLGLNDELGFFVAQVFDELTLQREAWRVDLTTGDHTVLSTSSEYWLSPDNKSFLSAQMDLSSTITLLIHDLELNSISTFELDPQYDGIESWRRNMAWSPDNKQVLLDLTSSSAVVSPGGPTPPRFEPPQEVILNLDTKSLQVVSPVTGPSFSTWFDDNNLIQISLGDSLLELGFYSIKTKTLRPIGSAPGGAPEPLMVLENSQLLIFDYYNDALYRYSPAGIFNVENAPLQNGLNSFVAVSLDEQGLASAPSNEVLVLYEAQSVPDLAVQLSLDNKAILVGGSVALTTLVSNVGGIASPPTQVSVSQIDPNGDINSLLYTSIGVIEPGSSVEVSTLINPSLLGEHAVTAYVDLEDEVEESDESNNTSIASFRVFDSLSPIIEVELTQRDGVSGFVYTANENVNGVVSLYNPGELVAGEMSIEVLDAFGNFVETVDIITVNNLSKNGTREVSFVWNTQDYLLGGYTLRAKFDNAGGDVSIEALASFSIDEALNVIHGLRANKYNYAANSDVVLTSTVINRSSAAVLADARLELVVVNDLGHIVHSESQVVNEILGGAQAEFPFTWNTGVAWAGEYLATTELSNDDLSFGFSTSKFLIKASEGGLIGTLALSENRLTVGQFLEYDTDVVNDGNTMLESVELEYELIDGTTETSVGSQSLGNLEAGLGQLLSGQADVSSLAQGQYRLRLKAFVGNQEAQNGAPTAVVLDEKPFVVREVTAPELKLISPINGSIVRSHGLHAEATAYDEYGIQSVEFNVDSTAWSPVQLSPIQSDRFTQDLSWMAEGPHAMQARTTDNNENQSNIQTLSFTVDNTPPDIEILNIEEGQALAPPLMPDVRVTDLHLDSWTMRVNGQVLGSALTKVGEYLVVLEATDKAGNTRRLERQFSIRPTPELLAANDTLAISRGVWGTVELFANDTISYVPDVQVSIIESPKSGALIEAGQGQFNYFPSLRFVGQDRFKYRLTSNATGLSSEADVLVDVAPVASCSFVADHKVNRGGVVDLISWARSSGDSSTKPRYRIEITGISDTAAFKVGGLPEISYPDCDLRYTPQDDIRETVKVSYQVLDHETDGDQYRSVTRSFTLSINSKDVSGAVIIPLLELLLLSEDEK